jgi:hypothetical protein
MISKVTLDNNMFLTKRGAGTDFPTELLSAIGDDTKMRKLDEKVCREQDVLAAVFVYGFLLHAHKLQEEPIEKPLTSKAIELLLCLYKMPNIYKQVIEINRNPDAYITGFESDALLTCIQSYVMQLGHWR